MLEKDTVVILIHHLRLSTIMYIGLYLLLFLSVVLKDENYEKYRDIYIIHYYLGVAQIE